MQHLADKDGNVILRPITGDLSDFDRFAPVDTPELPVKLGLFIDTETTGLSVASDRIVEIAILPFGFTDDGRFWGVGEPYCCLQDPGMPMPAEASRVNGLTDDKLAGQCINWAYVSGLFREASVVLAHNASFDRPFVEKEVARAKFQTGENTAWGCSLHMVPWDQAPLAAGAPPSKALPALIAWAGFWFPPHRAAIDTHAALYLLLQQGMFGPLVTRATLPDYSVQVLNNRNFGANDDLRARRYRFDNTNKFWWKGGILSKADAQEEVAWLGEHVYGRSANGARIIEVQARHRFL